MNPFNLFKNYCLGLVSSKTAKHTYLVFIGNSLTVLFVFIFTILLVRILSFSDFGYFSALVAFLYLISDISDAGIGNSLSHFLPGMRDDKNKSLSFLKTAFILQIGIVIVISFLVIVVSSVLAVNIFHSPNIQSLIIITAVAIVGAVMFNFFQYALAAGQNFRSMAISLAMNGILRLLFLLPFIILSSVSLTSAIWVQTISLITVALISLYFLTPRFLFSKRSAGDLKKLVSFSSFLGIARSLTTVSGKIDVLMLIALANSVETGIYATAARIIAVYPLFTGSFTTVIAPKISSFTKIKQLKKFMQKVIIATLIFIATIFAFIAIAYPFMTVLFGEKTIPSVQVLRLLLISMIFFVGSVPAVVLAVYYLKKPQILTLNSILQLIIVVIGNLFFIPKYGRLGPALSLILAYGITFFTTTYISYIYYKKHNQ